MTLLIYMVLTAAHRWEFLAVEHVGSREYCAFVAWETARVFSDTPGNVRIICAADTGGEA